MIDVPCQFCTKSIFISVVVLFYWINNIIFKTSFYFVYAHYLKRSSAIYMKYEYLSKQLLFRLSGVSKMHTKLFHFVRVLNCKWNLLHYILFFINLITTFRVWKINLIISLPIWEEKSIFLLKLSALEQFAYVLLNSIQKNSTPSYMKASQPSTHNL